jgi:hypothetical protein
MPAKMPVWLKELLTEADNVTPDFLRILACLGVLVFLSLAVANWRAFDPMAFGTGFGAVLVAAGAAVRLNEGPREQPPPAGPTTKIVADTVTVKNP